MEKRILPGHPLNLEGVALAGSPEGTVKDDHLREESITGKIIINRIGALIQKKTFRGFPGSFCHKKR